MLTGNLCRIGVVNMSFPLSDQPVFGEWFIFVDVQGHTYNKSFEVQKYGEAVNSTVYQEHFVFLFYFLNVRLFKCLCSSSSAMLIFHV